MNQELANIFLRFYELDERLANRFVEILVCERESYVRALLSSSDFSDIRYLQGCIFVLDKLISKLVGGKGGRT
ncbi:MAG: hypothetical protein QXX12_03855 [Nanopusillaceae archaeon]